MTPSERVVLKQLRQTTVEPRSAPLAVGLFVDATIEGEEIEKAYILPRDALRPGDHVYVVERLDFVEPRIRFTRRLVLPGGMIGTAVSQAAMLGCDAHLLSMLGDDADGRFVRSVLEEIGVETGRLAISRHQATARSKASPSGAYSLPRR